MNDIISIIILLTVYLVGLLFIIMTFNDMDRSSKKRKYEKKLKEAIISGDLQNNDVCLLAERWSVRHEHIKGVLLSVFNDFMADKNFSYHVPRLRELILWHEKHFPLEDLPDDIKQQLQNISSLPGAKESDVHLLTRSLHDIYTSNQKKAKRARRINYIMGFITIASFFITLFQILFK
ncbi:hypothetical protein [Escherichia coli]|uniref:Uncharacterized protein n=1 Tax=Escherichia coli TaxID=562 RepID=A0A797I2G1_ECOLX|nr:hypothetical protein [Escherichia coli]MBM2961831.1 hypothetical protein [Escherichia coli]MCV8059073.1 hypothetical protein [Escherichia coli]MDT1729370.1 hypothetical protein [Escherichia coli]NJZ26923.1 hypothetical protein [Escherichia coli]HAH0555367.1 hypothetical protein [Escherichia coli]